MYDGHACKVVFGSQTYEGFQITAGICQGCPLSPLLFAIAIDLFLRRLSRHLPTAKIRAFADDIAVVLPNLQEDLPKVARLFAGIGHVAGLQLNIPKCVLMPLWPVQHDQVRRHLCISAQEFASITISECGTYLGIVIGPGAGQSSWKKPLAKYLETAKAWGAQGLGLQYGALAYTTYVLPILSFVAQVCPIPEEAYKMEAKALRYMVPGPYQWCLPVDLFYLNPLYGQPRAFPRLADTVQAAQARVYHWENHKHGGLKIQEKCNSIRRLRAEIDDIGRLVYYFEWLESSPAVVLLKNRCALSAMGLDDGTLFNLAGQAQQLEDRDADNVKLVRQNFQRKARQAICNHSSPDPVARMRHKLARFNLPGLARHTSESCVRLLQRLAGLVPPRVSAACLRTLWNGWVTRDRFQQGAHSHCVFGCGMGIDSMKHYPYCNVVRRFRRSFLRLEDEPHEIFSNFVTLGVNLGTLDDNMLVRRAVLVYAVYCSSNQARNARVHITPENAEGMLQQNATNAASPDSNIAYEIDALYANF